MTAEEKCIAARELLEDKANLYKAFRTAYFVVQSPDYMNVIPEYGYDRWELTETGSCETFCEHCIDFAVARYKEQFNLERAKLLVKLDMVNEFGYYIENVDYKHLDKRRTVVLILDDGRAIGRTRKISKNEIENLRIYSQIQKEYRSGIVFDYQYTHDPSPHGDGFLNCDDCGELFDCFRMGAQEIENWKNHVDCFDVNEMSAYTAFELHQIFDWWNDCEECIDDVVLLAERVLDQTKQKEHENGNGI